jgi:mRNA-degrading endonuclease RelE of RelBE toxin-antitoxin system
MTLWFAEVASFTEVIEEYFGSDEHYLKLQLALIRNPDAGRVIPGTGGLRKIRWPDPARGKGRRGGLRVIYLYVADAQVVLFLDVYDKDEADDLSPEDKRALTKEAGEFREHVRNPW